MHLVSLLCLGLSGAAQAARLFTPNVTLSSGRISRGDGDFAVSSKLFKRKGLASLLLSSKLVDAFRPPSHLGTHPCKPALRTFSPWQASRACRSSAKSVQMMSPADVYMSFLADYPLPTKTVTACLLSTVGDAVAQFAEITGKRQQALEAGLPDDEVGFDRKRSLSYALFGAAYVGVFNSWAFPWLETNMQGDYLGALLSAVGGDQQLSAVIERTLVNQLVFVPLVYYPFYYALTGWLNGLDAEASVARAQGLYFRLLFRNLAYYLPVQYTQFAVIPSALMVPYASVAGLIWNIILSLSAGPPASSSNESEKSSSSGK